MIRVGFLTATKRMNGRLIHISGWLESVSLFEAAAAAAASSRAAATINHAIVVVLFVVVAVGILFDRDDETDTYVCSRPNCRTKHSRQVLVLQDQ